MKKSFIFFAPGIDGGTATLTYRLGKELIKRNYHVYYFYFKNNNDDNIQLLESIGIKVQHIDKKNVVQTISNVVLDFEKSIIMVYLLSLLHYIEKIKKNSHNVDVNVYLYGVRYDCLVYGGCKTRMSLSHKIANYLNKPYIRSIYRRNQLIFMDEETINLTEKKLKIHLEGVDSFLFRLPYNVPDYTEHIKPQTQRITTMARMSFPFKGYILGLIDIYSSLKMNYPNLRLDIIGDGEGMALVKNKIEEKRIEGITVYGRLDYNAAINVIKQATVFVGMGTGILDAVSYGIPSIPVQVHNFECRGKDLFCNNPVLAYEIEDENVSDIEDVIDGLLSLNETEYQKICKMNYECARINYSISEYIEKLEKIENKKTRLVDLIAAIEHKFVLAVLNKVLVYKNRRR